MPQRLNRSRRRYPRRRRSAGAYAQTRAAEADIKPHRLVSSAGVCEHLNSIGVLALAPRGHHERVVHRHANNRINAHSNGGRRRLQACLYRQISIDTAITLVLNGQTHRVRF